MEDIPHISVCVCTFRRPEWLARLLGALRDQETGELFRYSIVVADNDAEETAREVVSSFVSQTNVVTTYVVEPTKNFALVRNASIRAAQGEWIAFIDDDEVPGQDWLLQMFQLAQESGASGVLGPVRPVFEDGAPEWVEKCGLYYRKEHSTGYTLNWKESRTGNLLFRREILEDSDTPFDEAFQTGGEDIDFFKRMSESGARFVWCREAAVYESVPSIRWQKSVLAKRALLRGRTTLRHSKSNGKSVAKSMLAAIAYLLALPFLRVAGEHYYVLYLVRLCDHLGKILAFFGINPVKERAG